MSYRVVKTSGGETLTAIAARESIPYFKGSGFYQLLKKESVSADKTLVLYNGTEFQVHGVREKLGVGSGKVDVHPHQVPAGWMLFVNSTSPNRNVEAGHALFRTDIHASVPSAPAEKRGRTGKVKSGRRGKKKRGSDDEDGDGDGEGGGGEGEEGDGLIKWSMLTGDDAELPDDFAEDSELVSFIPGSWSDCDVAVPKELLMPAFDTVLRAFREFPVWKETETKSWDVCMGVARRHQWVAPGNAARLMYFQAEEALIYALEVPAWKFALVVGEAGAHPFLRARNFNYDNSDGSGCGTYIHEQMTPTSSLVLVNMARDLLIHGNDGSH